MSNKLKETVQKKHPHFVEAVDGLQLADLEKQLLFYSKSREDVLIAQKEDEKLIETKEILKELNGPYSDAIKDLKMKTAYLALLMKEKE